MAVFVKPTFSPFTPYKHPNGPIYQLSSDALLHSRASSCSLTDLSGHQTSSSQSLRAFEVVAEEDDSVDPLDTNVSRQVISRRRMITSKNPIRTDSADNHPSSSVSSPTHIIQFEELAKPNQEVLGSDQPPRYRKKSGPILGTVRHDATHFTRPRYDRVTPSVQVSEDEDAILPVPKKNPARHPARHPARDLIIDTQFASMRQPNAPRFENIQRPYTGHQAPFVTAEIQEVSPHGSELAESSKAWARRKSNFGWRQNAEEQNEIRLETDGSHPKYNIYGSSDAVTESPRRRSSLIERLAGLIRRRAKSDPGPDRKGKGIVRTVTVARNVSREQTFSDRPMVRNQSTIEKATDSPKGILRRMSWLAGARRKST